MHIAVGIKYGVPGIPLFSFLIFHVRRGYIDTLRRPQPEEIDFEDRPKWRENSPAFTSLLRTITS